MIQQEQNNIVANWQKLPPSFYEKEDVVVITKELIGKILVTNVDDRLTAEE